MTIIFPDRNISPAFFRTAAPGTLLVRTIFFTQQGEGPLAGQPSVFVRLGGCNLGAKGVGAAGCDFCDTDFRIDRSEVMSFSDIHETALEEIRKVTGASGGGGRFPDPLYVVTGGEPMLQKNLVDFCGSTGWRIQIETNGMYFLPLPDHVTVVVSPKVGTSGKYPKPKGEVLTIASCLKFVVSADPESTYHTIPEYGFQFTKPVYVSPMAVYRREMTPEEGERASGWDGTLIDREATARNYRYAAEYALKYGLRLSIQTHLFTSMP